MVNGLILLINLLAKEQTTNLTAWLQLLADVIFNLVCDNETLKQYYFYRLHPRVQVEIKSLLFP